jgi:hypothetical protein
VNTVNEWDDSLDMPAPCQPIGCDNGYHLPGCVFDDEPVTAYEAHSTRVVVETVRPDEDFGDGVKEPSPS